MPLYVAEMSSLLVLSVRLLVSNAYEPGMSVRLAPWVLQSETNETHETEGGVPCNGLSPTQTHAPHEGVRERGRGPERIIPELDYSLDRDVC